MNIIERNSQKTIMNSNNHVIYMGFFSEDEQKEIIKKRMKEGWIKAWFAIEAMAVSEEVVENALKEHIEKLSKTKDTMLLEKKFSEIKEVPNPPREIEKAFSQVSEVTILTKDLFTLINISILFGPSAIEILEPNESKIKIDEMQNIVNVVTGIIHRFASIGVGGIVMTTSDKRPGHE